MQNESIDRMSRQSFLGPDAQQIFSTKRVGIVGLGGGGSHIVQQLAHLGFCNFSLFDPDRVETSNLNRLVSATRSDAFANTAKTEVARRLIEGLIEKPNVELYQDRWQVYPDGLRKCDIVFGALDGLQERKELQVFTKRYAIAYIDLGLTVATVGGQPPRMTGQVALVTSESPCLMCLGIVTEEQLALEAAEYGHAGIRPQVVWANAALAASAVGLAVNLLTNWTRQNITSEYLSYDANRSEVGVHPRKSQGYIASTCSHFPASERGTPVLLAV